jgi:predicted P-loop ATPase
MNELKIVKADVSTIKGLELHLSRNLVPSLGLRSTGLRLQDFEEYFKDNYFVRFNGVSTKYEAAQLVIKEGDQEETVDWVPLELSELHNDLIRAGAKGKGALTDSEVKRMLLDRRLVPEHDPFREYFFSVQNRVGTGDEFDYIDDFASYLVVEGGEKENKRWKSNFKKALVRTVKCALDDRYFNKHCLVLYSADQSVGKTSYIRAIYPEGLKQYCYQGSIGTDKDSETVIGKNFIILLDELANLSRVDINVLKATLSKLMINIRLPYAATFTEFPRRASFFGTTNRNDFLTDSENVRWLIFNVDTIDRSYGNVFTGDFKVDIDKLWCQAYQLYRAGFDCELTSDDMVSNEVNNVLYSATSLEKEVINSYFSPAAPTDNNKKGFRKEQSSDIFELACKYLEEDGKIHSLKNIRQNIFFSELSRMSGWKKDSFRVGKRVVSGYCFFVNKEIDLSEKELPF